RRREARIRVGYFCPRLFADLRSPAIALPVNAFRRRLLSHSFPPNAALWSQSYIGENGVLRERCHRIRIGLHRRAWGDAEESRFRIDRPKLPACIRSDPRNVVAHRCYLPALEHIWWNHHGKICLAA